MGVLALDQSVVVGVPGARLGELADMELVQECGDAAVDVLRAVVGVEAQHVEREQEQQRFENRRHEPLGDARHGADVLVLRHFVHHVDDVHALASVPVAQMHRVHPHEARPTVGLRRLAHGNGHRAGARFLPPRALRAVGARRPQVVQVRARQPRQPLEAPVPVDLERAAQELARRQPRHPPERLVHVSQKPDVDRRVDRLERPPAVARPPILHRAGRGLLPDQPRDLRRREPAHLADIRPHPAPVGAAPAGRSRTSPTFAARTHTRRRGPGACSPRIRSLPRRPESAPSCAGAQSEVSRSSSKCEDSATLRAHLALDSALPSCSHSIGQFFS